MILAHMDSAMTVWSKRLGLVVLGWFAASAYHGTLEASKAVKAVPVLSAELGCEHWRAEKNERLAKQDSMVDPHQIPKDCPHPSLPK